MEDPTFIPERASSNKSSINFLGALADFNFETFITPKIIKFVYAISLVGVAVGTLGWIFAGGNFSSFLWRLLTSPIVLILGVIATRVCIELIMLAFKALEILKRIEANQKLQR